MASRYVLIVSVALYGFTSGNPTAVQSQSADRRAAGVPTDLEQTLEAIRAKYELPGLAAAIVRGQATIEAAVVGVRRLGAPDRIQLSDRFHIASCTKSMTATVAAVLVNEGRLTWTSRLLDLVPELRETARPEYRAATLEQLLAHAARTPAYTQFGPERLEELTSLRGSATEQRLAFLMEVLASEPPNRGSGDAAYSNVGYTAAALMMERAMGEAWEELVRKRLFHPLGLREVGFGWPASPESPEQPRGHVRRAGRFVAQPLDDSYMLPVALWPAGAVNSSISDLARYAADHLKGLRGEKALLPRAMYERLHRTLRGDAEGFTLGWGVRRDPRWGVVHYGAGSGGTFFVRIVIVPDLDAAIVVASNSGDAAAATRDVLDRLLAGAARLDAAVAQEGVSITFLANEGVMLSSGAKKVLIDALFQKYGTGFALPADSTRASLERARPPFDAVDLILVTHRHGDHFHPASVAAHMRANPRATLLTSRQVIDSLRGRLEPSAMFAPRFMARTTAAGTRRREVVNGIVVEVLGLPHTGGRRHRAVEHLGYIVDLGGRRVLHVGDTDVSESAFAPFRLDTARIDVALLPNWMVTSREGRRVIQRWIRPRQVVALHVGEGEERSVARAVQAALPGAVTFARSLETHTW